MSIYELKCSEHKNLAALFNAEMRDFSEFSSVGHVYMDLSDLHTWVLICRYANFLTYVNRCMWTQLLTWVKFTPYAAILLLILVRNKCKFLFAFMQILPMKAKLNLLTYENLSITSLRHMNVDSMLFQRCVSSRIIVSDWPLYNLYIY